jgi:hypothetical protein
MTELLPPPPWVDLTALVSIRKYLTSQKTKLRVSVSVNQVSKQTAWRHGEEEDRDHRERTMSNQIQIRKKGSLPNTPKKKLTGTEHSLGLEKSNRCLQSIKEK